MSLHTGTHADAPLHFDSKGRAISELGLDPFIGPAQVIEALGGGPIVPTEIQHYKLGAAPRWLFKTRREPAPNDWTNEFRYLTKELIDLAADYSVQLIGIDTPSVDRFDSRNLPSHHALKDYKIVNLENLKLDHVSQGVYWLFAPPVAPVGMDAGPARAILLDGILFANT